MALNLTEINAEIAKNQIKINATDAQITKGIKAQDKLKQKQQKQVEKQNKLQAAKRNLTQYNKAG